jgi:hypothetical protein
VRILIEKKERERPPKGPLPSIINEKGQPIGLLAPNHDDINETDDDLIGDTDKVLSEDTVTARYVTRFEDGHDALRDGEISIFI